MCVLCTQFWIDEHWTDWTASAAAPPADLVVLESHATSRGQRLRDRAARARLFNRLLGSKGLSLQDWEGSRYILRDAKGQSAVVPDLMHVWDAVEHVTGAAMDPLDPDFLKSIRRQANHPVEP